MTKDDLFDYGWMLTLWAALFAVFVLLVFVIVHPHHVQAYYLQTGSSGYCVWADADWEPDWSAYCTDDISKALSVMRQANESLVPSVSKPK